MNIVDREGKSISDYDLYVTLYQWFFGILVKIYCHQLYLLIHEILIPCFEYYYYPNLKLKW
jgi:hypothetical protein